MKFKKILTIGIAASQLDPSTWDIIDSCTDTRVSLSGDSPDIDEQLKDADCLLIYLTHGDRQTLEKAPQLTYVGGLVTGVGKIDLEYAASTNIVVTNIPGYSTESVAEFVFAILLENLRDLARAKQESKEGNRSELGFSAKEIKGKQFGVLGAGRIGERVAELAHAFGAHTSYWSRTKKKNLENKGIMHAEIDTILASSDILSIHFSLNAETENIINAERMAKIKSGAIVINTAPMELLDFEALEKRLKNGDMTFIFEHTDTGDISEENLKRFQQYKNCITYPAVGYISEEARAAKQSIFIENIKNFLLGTPTNKVN